MTWTNISGITDTLLYMYSKELVSQCNPSATRKSPILYKCILSVVIQSVGVNISQRGPNVNYREIIGLFASVRSSICMFVRTPLAEPFALRFGPKNDYYQSEKCVCM